MKHAFDQAAKKGENILADDIKIKCLAKDARITQEETRHWLQHLYEVKASWKQGAKKAAATRKTKASALTFVLNMLMLLSSD